MKDFENAAPVIAPAALQQPGDFDPLAHVQAAILRHPKFPLASRQYFEGIAMWRRTLGLANRFSSTEVATHIIYYVMLLHYGNPTGAPEAGATFGRLLNICETRKQCGARALRTVLVLANLAGYVHAARSPTDRRVQYYVPSPKLLEMVREFHRRALSCLDHLVDQPIYEQMADAGSAYLIVFIPVSVTGELRPTEHSAIMWGTVSELAGMPLAPSDRRYIEHRTLREPT